MTSIISRNSTLPWGRKCRFQELPWGKGLLNASFREKLVKWMWVTTKQATSFDKVEGSGEKLANKIWTKEWDLTTTFYRRRKEIPLKALTEITSRNNPRNSNGFKRGRKKEEDHNICITLIFTANLQLHDNYHEFHWQLWQRSLPGTPGISRMNSINSNYRDHFQEFQEL